MHTEVKNIIAIIPHKNLGCHNVNMHFRLERFKLRATNNSASVVIRLWAEWPELELDS
jgi:hypothetical protein